MAASVCRFGEAAAKLVAGRGRPDLEALVTLGEQLESGPRRAPFLIGGRIELHPQVGDERPPVGHQLLEKVDVAAIEGGDHRPVDLE